MSGPMRIQLRRAKGWRMPDNTVKVDRTTPFGNPFIPGQDSRVIPGRKVQDKRHAASLYLGFAPQNERLVEVAREQLAGKNLGCWCNLCEAHQAGRPFTERCVYCDPCHADTLGQIANGGLP